MDCEEPAGELRRVVEQYSRMLLKLAMTRLRDTADAEDCVQEVYCKLLRARPRFFSAEHEKAWLIRATLNQACDLRRAPRCREVSLEEAPPLAAPEASPLLSALRTLPEKYSAVIHLHYYEGYSLEEISKLLALPVATVGTRLARGRKRLRAMLEEEL